MIRYVDGINVKLPADVLKQLRKDAKKRKTTISDIVRQLLAKAYPET